MLNRVVGLTLAGLSVTGCIEYDVNTILNSDGGGSRSVRIEAKDAEDLQDYALTTSDFVDLLSLSPGSGWTHQTEVDEGDTVHVFTREDRLRSLDAWSNLNDGLRILGAVPSRAGGSVGYVTLGDVQFRNRVLVGNSRRSDGSASFSYQESFYWEDGVDALVEVILEQMAARIRNAFPGLSDGDRGEILGIARAQLWESVEDGVLDSSGDNEDELWDRAVAKTATQAIRVVRTHRPDVDQAALKSALDVFSGESEELLLEGLVANVPGLNLAINTEVTFRLTMPGQVTDTNAHDREGNTLTWTFSPADALTAPVVISAESVSGG
jgi:hypothetical protein